MAPDGQLPGLVERAALPAAVFVNAVADWALAQVTIDDQSPARAGRRPPSTSADPLTEATCWSAAWHADGPPPAARPGRLRRASSPAADVQRSRLTRPISVPPNGRANLPGRGLPGGDPAPSPPTPTAAQALLGRALICADRYVARRDRAAVQAVRRRACPRCARREGQPIHPAWHPALRQRASLRRPRRLRPLRRADLHAPARRQRSGRLRWRRSSNWANARRLGRRRGPDRPEPAAPRWSGPRWRSEAWRIPLRPPSLTGKADPGGRGAPARTTCEAARPDPAAKAGGLGRGAGRADLHGVARAQAEGIWMKQARKSRADPPIGEQYFAEALPALSARDARGERLARRLADLLFPVTLDEQATITRPRRQRGARQRRPDRPASRRSCKRAGGGASPPRPRSREPRSRAKSAGPCARSGRVGGASVEVVGPPRSRRPGRPPAGSARTGGRSEHRGPRSSALPPSGSARARASSADRRPRGPGSASACLREEAVDGQLDLLVLVAVERADVDRPRDPPVSSVPRSPAPAGSARPAAARRRRAGSRGRRPCSCRQSTARASSVTVAAGASSSRSKQGGAEQDRPAPATCPGAW